MLGGIGQVRRNRPSTKLARSGDSISGANRDRKRRSGGVCFVSGRRIVRYTGKLAAAGIRLRPIFQETAPGIQTNPQTLAMQAVARRQFAAKKFGATPQTGIGVVRAPNPRLP